MPSFFPEGDAPIATDPSNKSLQKINSLLQSIDSKTGSTTITGPVTVSNEVEVTNDEGNPLPVSGTVTAVLSFDTIFNDGGDRLNVGLGSVVGTDPANWLKVDGGSVPISGTVTANAGTGTFAVSASSLPLPSGAATSANQTTANTSLANIDADIGSTSDSAATTDSGTFSLISLFKRLLSTKIPDQSSGRIPVTLSSAGTNGSTAPTTSNLFGGTDGTNLRAVSTDSSGRINTNINGTVPVSGTFWQTTQPVSGTVGISGTVPVSGTFWQATQPVSGSVSVSNFPATQTVSGTVTANTGLSQPLTDTQLRATAVPVSGPLTDTQLRATAVPVSGSVSVSNLPATQPVSGTVGISGTVPVSGTFWQATQPVSLSSAISQRVQGWDIPIHDYRSFGYTSGNLTSITYKTGGAGGTTVATLTLTYDGGGNLTAMTKT